MPVAHVALPVPLPRTFDYLLPDSMTPAAGGRRARERAVWQTAAGRGIVRLHAATPANCRWTSSNRSMRCSTTAALFLPSTVATAAVGGGLLSSPDWRRAVPRPADPAAPGQTGPGSAAVAVVRHTKAGREVALESLKRAPKQQQALAALRQRPKIWRHQVDELEVSETALQALRAKGLCDLAANRRRQQHDWRRQFLRDRRAAAAEYRAGHRRRRDSQRGRSFLRLAAGGRHRFRQDRGLPERAGKRAGAGQTGAGDGAGNWPDAANHRPLPRAL